MLTDPNKTPWLLEGIDSFVAGLFCAARRMAGSAALLVDEVLPERPMRQWVLSFPFQQRFLFVSCPAVMGQVLGIVYRVIATRLSRVGVR